MTANPTILRRISEFCVVSYKLCRHTNGVRVDTEASLDFSFQLTWGDMVTSRRMTWLEISEAKINVPIVHLRDAAYQLRPDLANIRGLDNVLFGLSVNEMQFDTQVVRRVLAVACTLEGGQTNWANNHGVGRVHVNQVLRGRCDPADKIAAALGMTRRTYFTWNKGE